MALFWVAGVIFAALFVFLNAMAKDWSNPYFWLILMVFAIMAFDSLR
jgi:hypothetical protein